MDPFLATCLDNAGVEDVLTIGKQYKIKETFQLRDNLIYILAKDDVGPPSFYQNSASYRADRFKKD